MDVIVTGGRDFTDLDFVCKVLDALKPTHIIHGGASGADTCAKYWAVSRGITHEVFEANWEKYGKAAGPRRNENMVWSCPNAIIVAFPGGAGTANCVETALKDGRVVFKVVAP